MDTGFDIGEFGILVYISLHNFHDSLHIRIQLLKNRAKESDYFSFFTPYNSIITMQISFSFFARIILTVLSVLCANTKECAARAVPAEETKMQVKGQRDKATPKKPKAVSKLSMGGLVAIGSVLLAVLIGLMVLGLVIQSPFLWIPALIASILVLGIFLILILFLASGSEITGA